MMTAKPHLLPCPFCGGDAMIKSDPNGHWIECEDCRARTLDEFSCLQVAEHAWNMRQPGKVRKFFSRLPSDLFAIAWRHRLNTGDQVIKVRGWRTALIQTRSGSRQTITMLFQS